MKSKRFVLKNDFESFIDHFYHIYEQIKNDIEEIKKNLLISKSPEEKVISKLLESDLGQISYTGKVKKINDHKYLIFCPFHDEKTPSFMLNNLTHEYYCFSCGQKGKYDPANIKLNDEQLFQPIKKIN